MMLLLNSIMCFFFGIADRWARTRAQVGYATGYGYKTVETDE